jgi:hypothetical protein
MLFMNFPFFPFSHFTFHIFVMACLGGAKGAGMTVPTFPPAALQVSEYSYCRCMVAIRTAAG